MKASKLWSGAAILAISVAAFAIPATAHADTYKIYDLGDANGFNVYGIDTAGAVVISDNLAGPTYYTWANGAIINSLTVPVLAYDNGTPCSPVLSPGMTLIPGTKTSCNNGREVFGGEYMGTNMGIYTGSNPTDFLRSGTADALVLNASGDFAWTDGLHEENFEAIDLSTAMTPEPNSFILLGTGLFAALGTMRRRLFQ
ncbi:MAG TPA: PEP-CTERM sorting domain-containing protein [Acidobacteriaceae bacterium]|nr:PEP-CTERM sorting domain-containing protein [Acidobacteriaceae bacterium]